MEKRSVLAISGSLRARSYNTSALKFAIEAAPPLLEIELFGLHDIPPYNEDVRQKSYPPGVAAFREKVRKAAAVLIATPEYNRSIPGVLKNAIDWTSRPPDQPWAGKPIAIMGVSPGRFGTARAQHDLHKVLVALDTYIMNKPDVMISHAETAFDANGVLTDKRAADQITSQLLEFSRWVERFV